MAPVTLRRLCWPTSNHVLVHRLYSRSPGESTRGAPGRKCENVTVGDGEKCACAASSALTAKLADAIAGRLALVGSSRALGRSSPMSWCKSGRVFA